LDTGRRIPALVADSVRRSVNVIVVAGVDERNYRTVQAATSIVPIVFLTASDPVKMGLVPNFNHPGGNITGITSLFVEIGQKRLGLLRELLPHANAFAALRVGFESHETRAIRRRSSMTDAA
jgi:putative tryptophan/tyrosine transport system substrate-binding protein